MTKQEFMEKLSLASSVSPFKKYSAEVIEEDVRDVYPNKLDMDKTIKIQLKGYYARK